MWYEYLANAHTKEENLNLVQRDEMKRSFYAGTMLVIAAIADRGKDGQTDEKLIAWLTDLNEESHDFFSAEFAKMQKDVTLLAIMAQSNNTNRLSAIVQASDSIERLTEQGLLKHDNITNRLIVTERGRELIERHSKFKG